MAFNWGLARVKAVMDQRAAEATYGLPGDALTAAMSWSLYSLRKEWNAAKGVAAAWWSQCSKEAFNTGLGQLAVLSRTGRTPGPESARAAGLVKRQPGRAAPAAHKTGFHRKVGLRYECS